MKMLLLALHLACRSLRTLSVRKLGLLCCVCGLWAQPSVWAQDGNILGLPPVPQKPLAGEPANAASAAAKPGTAKGGSVPIKPAASDVQINDAQAKSVLNGGVTMASSYTETRAVVMVTTYNAYKTPESKQAALTAARFVQRDLVLSCGRHCKPTTMAPAKILPDGKLQFPMAIDGFGRVLSFDDMMTLLLGKPLFVAAAPGTLPGNTPTAVPAATTTSSAIGSKGKKPAAAPALVASPGLASTTTVPERTSP